MANGTENSSLGVKNPFYANKRYWLFLVVTIIIFALPWIRIDGNHIFLLSFDHKELHLMGVDYDMQELFLMPFLLMLLFIGIFAITSIGGRVWCGWACPQTIFRVIYRDFIETKLLGLRKNIKNKQKEPDLSSGANKVKKVIGILIWSVLSFVAAANFLWYFVPPEDFFAYLANPGEHMILVGILVILAGFLIYDVVSLKENFCVYICPYSRVQSVLYDNDTVMSIYDYKRGGEIYNEKGDKLWKKPPEGEGECTGCESCVTICPTHIDIRKGFQLECINCLECVDACSKVMGKLGKETLVSWNSSNAIEKREKVKYLRPKSIGYMVVLAIVLTGLIIMGSGKQETFLLNINRTSELYTINEQDKIVQNSYVFLFQNKDAQEHEVYFKVDNPNIKIARPSEPFMLKKGVRLKKVVVLETDKVLGEHKQDDTVIPIKVTLYSVDDKNIVTTIRDSVFFYPGTDYIEGAK
jgi:cytochrome c oxidase accessory protein FixG